MRVESISEERAAPPLHSIYFLYHELRPSRSEYSYVVETEKFKQHVELFAQMRSGENRGLWPELTFDDGHLSNYEQALPVLLSRGLTARFFITVGWTGNRPGYMGWPELRALHESGQIVGAHGWTHTLLTHCAPEALDKELRSARLLLEEKLGASITTMSLPGGRCNKHILAACRQAGYTQVFTSIPRAERSPSEFMVGRLNVRSDMTLEWIRNLLQPGSETLRSLERQYAIKDAAKKLLGDGLYEKLWELLNRRERESGGEDYAG